jgi:uncharacterized membrane protein YtjA (UPF0391 family)
LQARRAKAHKASPRAQGQAFGSTWKIEFRTMARLVRFDQVTTRQRSPQPSTRRSIMLYYALVFFIIALIAALFGFGGIAAGAAAIAKILFVVFLIVALVTFLLSLARR